MEQNKDIVLEGNPKKKERLQALLEGKIIRVNLLEEAGRIRYMRLNKTMQLEHSLTGRTNTYELFESGYDYSPAMEDFNPEGVPRRIVILDDCE